MQLWWWWCQFSKEIQSSWNGEHPHPLLTGLAMAFRIQPHSDSSCIRRNTWRVNAAEDLPRSLYPRLLCLCGPISPETTLHRQSVCARVHVSLNTNTIIVLHTSPLLYTNNSDLTLFQCFVFWIWIINKAINWSLHSVCGFSSKWERGSLRAQIETGWVSGACADYNLFMFGAEKEKPLSKR